MGDAAEKWSSKRGDLSSGWWVFHHGFHSINKEPRSSTKCHVTNSIYMHFEQEAFITDFTCTSAVVKSRQVVTEWVKGFECN